MNLFIAQTIDGFIAGEGGSLEHLRSFAGVDYGFDAFIASADAVVLGRATFDVLHAGRGWPYAASLPGVVMTTRALPADVPRNVRTATDPQAVARKYPNAYLDGGGATIGAFLDLGLVTHARIFTLPILLGRGVRLFADRTISPTRWTLLEAKRFDCGTVLHHYEIGSAARG